MPQHILDAFMHLNNLTKDVPDKDKNAPSKPSLFDPIRIANQSLTV